MTRAFDTELPEEPATLPESAPLVCAAVSIGTRNVTTKTMNPNMNFIACSFIGVPPYLRQRLECMSFEWVLAISAQTAGHFNAGFLISFRSALGHKQAAEKLVRTVGRDFSPGIRQAESVAALAAEVCFSATPFETCPFSAASSARTLQPNTASDLGGTAKAVPFQSKRYTSISSPAPSSAAVPRRFASR